MSKNRFSTLFVLVITGLLLAACNTSLPAGADVDISNDGQSAQVEFTGLVESIASDQWVVQGYPVLITSQTVIEGAFSVGDSAHVHAVVDENGNVTATRIEGFSGSSSTPTPIGTDDSIGSSSGEAEFFGVVESIAPDQWIVSGQTFLITPQTEIKNAIAVGDAVKVHASRSDSNVFVAREIELAAGTGSVTPVVSTDEIELVGVVESIASNLWTVSGQQFAVNAQTEIKNAIAVGDLVKVHLLVNADNSLTAREIELALTDGTPVAFGMMELTGVVQFISATSWTIGGKTFLITPQTEIKDAFVVGDLVKVEAIINPDNTLTATEIHRAFADNSDDNSGSSSSDDDDNSSDGSGSGSDDDDDDDNSGPGSDDSDDDDSGSGNG